MEYDALERLLSLSTVREHLSVRDGNASRGQASQRTRDKTEQEKAGVSSRDRDGTTGGGSGGPGNVCPARDARKLAPEGVRVRHPRSGRVVPSALANGRLP